MGSEAIKCRATECPVLIRMLTYRKTGKSAPIEVKPSENGNIHVDLEQGTYIILTGEELQSARNRGLRLHLNHFASCEFRDTFSQNPAPVHGDETTQLTQLEANVIRLVSRVVRAGEDKSCANCLTQLTRLTVRDDSYRCPTCDAKVCVVCGCTEKRACPGGCSWVEPGFCSTHVDEMDAALRRVSELTNVKELIA
jgi:hypothetical protein